MKPAQLRRARFVTGEFNQIATGKKFAETLLLVGHQKFGGPQFVQKLLRRAFRRVKAEALFHLTPNISYPLMIVVSALMLPVMIVRFYMGWFQMVVIDLPLIAASFWSISAFYVIAHRELFPKNWKRAFLFLPAASNVKSAHMTPVLVMYEMMVPSLCRGMRLSNLPAGCFRRRSTQ